MNRLALKLHGLTHWEYWPMKVIYYPLFPVWAFFAMRARSFFFFNAANPGIRNGGMALESKKEIYDIIPPEYIPKTLLIRKGTNPERVAAMAEEAGIEFPMIAKPDIGMKAFGVEKVDNEAAARAYAAKIKHDFLLQELITYPNEIGLFYVRYPGSSSGEITGIVLKEFLSVTGDGQHTLRELIARNPRACIQRKELGRRILQQDRVPARGEQCILVPFGSHTRGARFIDISHRANKALVSTFNDICRSLPGFYFGRLDIRYASFEELSEGKNFKIIEINGAGSEPTHIYDVRHSIFFAWREITRHWNLLFQISRINHRRGVPYMAFQEGRKMLRENSRLENHLKLI